MIYPFNKVDSPNDLSLAAIYNSRLYKGMYKFLEDTTQYLSGPSQMSYDEESLSESLELPDSEKQFHNSVNLGDSDSDSDENLLINSLEI